MKGRTARKAKYARRMKLREERATEALALEMEQRLTETPAWAREGTVVPIDGINYVVREAKLKQRYIRVSSMGKILGDSLFFHVPEHGKLRRIEAGTYYNWAMGHRHDWIT
jgi:hypothetical protein